jgi:hypothetical protein
MNLDELEEALEEILPKGFTIDTDDNGEIVIYTGLAHDDDDECLIKFVKDDEDDDVDPDFEPLEDDDDDDE